MRPPWCASIRIYSGLYEVAVRASSHIGAGALAVASVCAHLALAGCLGGNAQRGESCAVTSDCDEDLQCLERVCARRCHSHVDCGDGYTCEYGGTCALVTSAVGDRCHREIECGPGQACLLDPADEDGDGTLAGTCELQRPGFAIADECTRDSECQVGVCSLGLCTQLCQQASDCPPGMACASMPRLFDDSAPRFSGCLPAGGVLAHDFPMSAPSETVRVPVPSTAKSFALVAQVEDEEQLVGAERVVAPDGSTLYARPSTAQEYYANPIRYQPRSSVSTLLVSNTPSIEVEAGVYEVTVSSQLGDGGPGTAVPSVRVFYKLDTAATLDLHFNFLDLSDHPCGDAFEGDRLDADSAQESEQFRFYLASLGAVFESAGVHVGDVTYRDMTDRDDLDSIDHERAGALFALAERASGVNVFFVRSIAPAGVQAMIGDTPGPPRTAGTPASGVAIGVDTLCYRGWPELARITAHAVARQMGLHYNRDPGGHLDTIPDSDDLSSNLMFFGDLGGQTLSAGQHEVLRRYPGLR
jgi:hypothetical protein